VTAHLCECGCGQTTNLVTSSNATLGLVRGEHRRFVNGHNVTNDGAILDRLAVAVFTGAADARNGRPRRVDIADTSPIGHAYTRGYNALDGWKYQ